METTQAIRKKVLEQARRASMVNAARTAARIRQKLGELTDADATGIQADIANSAAFAGTADGTARTAGK